MKGDLICSIDGSPMKDVIDYQLLADVANPVVEVDRGGERLTLTIEKAEGEPAGIRFDEALFDGTTHCNNKCEFCFIYQLPEGLRSSLYEKDDDYRLSFLYGNFTTLTRFNERDLRRVLEDRISPLYVSIHTANSDLRGEILRNPKGGKSLRWLEPLLDGGIEIHGQIVLCPGINDGNVLDETLAAIEKDWPEMASVGVVPVGVGKYYSGVGLRPANALEMHDALDRIHRWQETFVRTLGRRMVFAADEFYLGCGLPFPSAESYEGFPQYENGIGMARSLIDEAAVVSRNPAGTSAIEAIGGDVPSVVVTGELGAGVLRYALAEEIACGLVEVLPVHNTFFGGNVGVTGLLTAEDISAAANLWIGERGAERSRTTFLLPRIIAPFGTTIDGAPLESLIGKIESLGSSVDVLEIDGAMLRERVISGCTAARRSSHERSRVE